MDFHITVTIERRGQPQELDPTYLADQEPSWVALQRFNALYHGELTVPLEGGVLTFWLEDDFSIIFDQLPGWLTRLAEGDGEASLLVGSQGTELTLDATRRGDVVVLSAHSIVADRPLPASLRPITVPADRFLLEWVQFVNVVLDAVARVSPEVTGDPGWQSYRRTIDAARP